MLAQIADLRICALMSLRPYVLVPLCPCTLMSAPLCLRLYVGFRIRDILLFGLPCRQLQKLVLSYLNAGARNIARVHRTNLLRSEVCACFGNCTDGQ